MTAAFLDRIHQPFLPEKQTPRDNQTMPSKEKLAKLKDRLAGKTPAIRQDVMDNHVNEKEWVDLSELREAIDANPNHPHADAYRKACGDLPGQQPLPGDRKVAVDKVDLQALLEDGSVESIRAADKDGFPVCRKVLVKAQDAPKAATGGPGKSKTK